MALRNLLKERGIDADATALRSRLTRSRISAGMSFGVMAARRYRTAGSTASGPTAWAPSLRCKAEQARWFLDARRDPGVSDFTMASVVASDRLIETRPDVAASAVRAIVKAKLRSSRTSRCRRHRAPALSGNRSRADRELIRRDLPYYSPAISRPPLADDRFLDCGQHSQRRPAYEDVVARNSSPLARLIACGPSLVRILLNLPE